jgi:hypothetical protein
MFVGTCVYVGACTAVHPAVGPGPPPFPVSTVSAAA